MGWDPSWSPDGLRIVYNGDEGIETASAAGGDERLVVVDGLQPDWSPDGGSIVFVREGNLWTVSIDGSNERQITHLGNDEWPAWSRDGNHIAFARAEPDAWHRTVWLVGAQGGPEARITPIVEGEAYAYPAWSRDGTRLTYFVLSWATSRIGIAIDRDWMPTAVQPRTWSAVKTRYR
jgi:Tol biopolymer transport system component